MCETYTPKPACSAALSIARHSVAPSNGGGSVDVVVCVCNMRATSRSTGVGRAVTFTVHPVRRLDIALLHEAGINLSRSRAGAPCYAIMTITFLSAAG